MSYNGPNILEIDVSSKYLPDVVSAYDDAGNFIPPETSTFAINEFPWLEFLEEDKLVKVSNTIEVRLTTIEKKDWIASTQVSDPLQFYMDREARYFPSDSVPISQSYVRLPSTLSFIYDDQPYITLEKFSERFNELIEAASLQTVSSELEEWVLDNTAMSPTEVVLDASIFRASLPVDAQGVTVSTKMAHLNEETVTSVNATMDDSGIYLEEEASGLFTLYIGKRVGDRISLTLVALTSESPVKNIYFGTKVAPQTYTENSSYKRTLTFNTLYSETRQIPIELASQTLTKTLDIKLEIFTSGGKVFFPPDLMNVGGVGIPTDEAALVSLPESSLLYYLGESIAFPMVGDEDVYFDTSLGVTMS